MFDGRGTGGCDWCLYVLSGLSTGFELHRGSGLGAYGNGTLSNGCLIISSDIRLDVSDKHVILVEDIVDTGNTLLRLIEHMKSKGASSVSVCTFLNKPSRRQNASFECPDYFAVGYGMDFAERYRNLPYLGILKPRCYQGIKEEHIKN